jgi:ribosomal protein S18 acetylase RimI-like enzyme
VTDNYLLREDFDDAMFTKAVELWKTLGLYRERRGDHPGVVRNTLAQGGRFLTLWDGDELIGTAWLMNDGRRLHLHYMGIRVDRQGRGLSKLLMERVMGCAHETGLGVKLEVHVKNEPARKLYESYGFEYLDDYQVMLIRKV